MRIRLRATKDICSLALLLGSLLALLPTCVLAEEVTKDELIARALGDEPGKSTEALKTLAYRFEKSLTRQDVDRLASLLTHPDVMVRLGAAQALVYGHNLGERHIERALDHPSMDVRLCAATGLLYGRRDNDRKKSERLALPVFEAGLFDRNIPDSVRLAVTERLVSEREYFMEPVYIRMLAADLPEIRRAGVLLSPLKQEVFAKLAGLVHDQSRGVRQAVVSKLAWKMEFEHLREPAVPILRAALEDRDDSVLAEAIFGLQWAKDRECVPRLVAILKGEGDPEELRGARLHAGLAIASLTGRRFDFSPARSECRQSGDGIRVRVLLDDPDEVKARHLRERKRLLEWWETEGKDAHGGERKQ